jgi:hypothetical protein
MFRISVCACAFFLLVCCVLPLAAQQPTAASANVSVPPMVNFSGTLTDLNNKPLTGVVGVTFCLYQQSSGGAPLWVETQNVRPDKTGHYTVMLGSTHNQGLPATLFASGEARWLGVQAQGQEEQPRILLLSVPYALKALDAETIGGKPASAFALASPTGATVATTPAQSAITGKVGSHDSPPVGGGGTTGFIAEWANSNNLSNSALFQDTSGDVGLSTTSPTQKLEVDFGNMLVRGPDNFTRRGDTASLYVGDANHPIEAIRNGTAGGIAIGVFQVPQALFLQDNSGRVGVGTTFPEAGLDVNGTSNIRDTLTLFANGNSPTLAVSGSEFSIGGRGLVSFVNGQTFPGTGTVSTVESGLGLVGGPIFTSGTLSIDTSVVPRLGAPNTFLARQRMNNGMSIGGTIQAQDGSFPLLMNSVSCCDSGTRMIWAHDPSRSMWGIYYDDAANIMHWQQAVGADLMTLNFNNGDVNIRGRVSKGGGSFKIDHPLDPANKYLYHSFVESPDMMNIYNGVATLNAHGTATIALPDFFEALNRDFRYQLTSIGRSQPGLYIAKEISGNRFEVAGGKPGGKVSWQVTGIRQDAYANAHRIPVEEEKPPKEQGHYLYPELFEKPQVADAQLSAKPVESMK